MGIGLVQEQQIGLVKQCSGHPRPPFEPCRELTNGCGCAGCEPEEADDGVDARRMHAIEASE
jgi:hypothetical protein